MPTLTQAMLDASASSPLVLTAGVWSFSSPLTIPSGARISGHGAVLQPSLTWADATTPALKAVSKSDIIIEDIEIDGRGDERTAVNTIAQLLLLDATSDVELTDVTFRDGGVSDGAPSGPLLGIAARDAADDITGAGVGSTIGTSSNIVATRCRFVQSTGAVVAFGVRVVTDWTKERAKSAFTHHCRDIHFIDCEWDGRFGEMYWNHIEFAGGGTKDMSVSGCTFRGKCLSAIDFDKGSHHGQAYDCTITDGGKPDREVGDVTTRLAVINAHGSSSTYKTTDIYVHDCTLDGFSSASSDVYESMLSVQNAERILYEDCTISDLNDSAVGYGVVVDNGTDDIAFVRITMRDVAGGFSTNLGAKGYADLYIEGCDIEAVSVPIVLGAGDGATAGSQSRLTILNTRAVRTTDAIGYIVNITSVWASALVEDNGWLGNGDVSVTPTSTRARTSASGSPIAIVSEAPTAPESPTRYGSTPFALVRSP